MCVAKRRSFYSAKEHTRDSTRVATRVHLANRTYPNRQYIGTKLSMNLAHFCSDGNMYTVMNFISP